MAISDYFTYDTNRPAREVLLELADLYGVTVVDMNDSVITRAEVMNILAAEKQAMYNEYPDEFAAMDWPTFVFTLEQHRLKYVALLDSMTLVARAEYRDILTKAAVESLMVNIHYQRLDGQILDYVIFPYEYIYWSKSGDLITTYAVDRGSRNFLVASIIRLELTNKSFTPWPSLPVEMTSYYDTNNLSDLVQVYAGDIDLTLQEHGNMTFQEWLVWLPDQTFEVDGISYNFVGLYHFLDAFLNIFHDLIDAIVDWGKVEYKSGAGWFKPVLNRYNIYLKYVQLYSVWSMGVPELGYLHVGPELWDAVINHTTFLDAIPNLADHEWACAMIVYAYDPYDFGYTGSMPGWKWYINKYEINAQANRENLSKDTAKVITGLENFFKDIAFRFNPETSAWDYVGLFGFS